MYDDKTGIDTNEGWIRIGNQLLVFPLTQKNPDGCDYVRVVKDDPAFTEIAYWSHTEWEGGGSIEVMGALMGCLCGGIPGYDPRVMPKKDPEPTMMALVVAQGTVCAETGLCPLHYTPEGRAKAWELSPSCIGAKDPALPDSWVDCTGNDQVFCCLC